MKVWKNSVEHAKLICLKIRSIHISVIWDATKGMGSGWMKSIQTEPLFSIFDLCSSNSPNLISTTPTWNIDVLYCSSYVFTREYSDTIFSAKYKLNPAVDISQRYSSPSFFPHITGVGVVQRPLILSTSLFSIPIPSSITLMISSYCERTIRILTVPFFSLHSSPCEIAFSTSGCSVILGIQYRKAVENSSSLSISSLRFLPNLNC